MKKNYLLACILAVSFFGQQAMADVKIGFTGALSGPAAALGQDQYDGFMLAVEQNKGMLGGEAVEVIREDDQVKPEIGLQAARKLVDQDKVDAIVGMGFTNVLMAMLPPIIDSGVVAIATNSGPLTLSGAGCQPNVFSTAWQSDGPAEAMGVYAQENNFNNVYLMAPNYQAGKEMLAGFKRFYKGDVVDEVYTPLSQTDFSAEITMLQASSPEAVFVFYPGGLGINFVKQMRQAGMLEKIPVLSVFTVDGTTLPALKGLADGVIAGAMWDASLENDASKEFVKAYQEKYGRVPSLYSASGYDAANLLGAAIESVDGKVSDKVKFAAAVKEAGSSFQSVRGPFKFNNNNMPIQNFYAFQAEKTDDGVMMKHIDTPLKNHKDAYHNECKLK
ncbi:ABC transporter substrate-binding protein [Neopusillimonas maritima]|uniref:ABC transporter substrate-binding protein n=1 Tax=Neopusillimonas maritima TaxID=2026239 RepID=A0A3A1YN65_9BURK|nr:ABC transporter substrate-binding protein [Neopusillimonas maritima]RII83683.1 ABC transporter substrate-binding protein [Neopusillimonas maritima]RIY39602.1 ABC transporter substrate-binding protein [Neopusillimonas maritima]